MPINDSELTRRLLNSPIKFISLLLKFSSDWRMDEANNSLWLLEGYA